VRGGSGYATLGTLALTRATPHGDTEGSVLAGMKGGRARGWWGRGTTPSPSASVVIISFPVLLAHTEPLPPICLPEMISRPIPRWGKNYNGSR